MMGQLIAFPGVTLPSQPAPPPQPVKPVSSSAVSPIRPGVRVRKKNHDRDELTISFARLSAFYVRKAAALAVTDPNSRDHQYAVHMIGVDRKLPRNNLRCIWSTLDERRDFDLRCAEIEVLRAEYALENAKIDRLSEIEGTPWWDERSTRRPLIEANRDRWEVIRERITQLAETPARTRQHLEKKLRMIGKAWLALDSEFGERLRAGVAADEAWLDQHQPKRTRKRKQQ